MGVLVPAQLLPASLPTHPRWVRVNPTEMYSKESDFTLTLMFNLLKYTKDNCNFIDSIKVNFNTSIKKLVYYRN